MKNKIFGGLLAVAICELIGVAGAIFTTPAIPLWYAGLVKPPLNPPNWIFGPVWSTLFALMGVSAYLVWRRRKEMSAVWALAFFALQLALNVLWSYLFFGLHAPAFAAIEIVALWLSILWTAIEFAKISRLSAALLAPYLLWVAFAVYLNYSIVLLN
jgi:tryptophan-rich sensory protein